MSINEGVLSGKHIDIYKLLSEIRKRPTMFFHSQSMYYLGSFLDGYYAACSNFEIINQDREFFVEFQDWLLRKYKEISPLQIRRYDDIMMIISFFDEYRAFEEFFKHLDKFIKEKNDEQV